MNQLKYSRLIGALGREAVARLHRSEFLLFGAGRNGSLMAESLVRLGCRQLTIIDPDTIGPENLDATFGSSESDVGQPKATSIVRYLHQINPDCLLIGLPMDAAHPDTIDLARNADFIVTCVDSDVPRLAAARLANKFMKVHLDVGSIVRNAIDGSSREIAADIRLMLPGSCVACVGGLRNHQQAASVLAQPVVPIVGRVKIGPALTESGILSDEKLGSLISLTEIAVGCGVQLLLDLLTGDLRQSFWQRILWQPGLGPRCEGAIVEGARDCPVCGV